MTAARGSSRWTASDCGSPSGAGDGRCCSSPAWAPPSTWPHLSRAELCARGHQVIGFDAPGVGGSTAYRWRRRLPRVVRTIARLVATSVTSGSTSWACPSGARWRAAGPFRPRARGPPDPGRHGARARRGPGLPARPPQPCDAVATGIGSTTRAPPGGPTAVRPAGIREPCCTLAPGPSDRPRPGDTWASRTRSPAGPACPGCTGYRIRPSSWPATTTRSCRWSTAACWPGASPMRACTSSEGEGTCFSSSGPRTAPDVVSTFLTPADPRAAPPGRQERGRDPSDG